MDKLLCASPPSSRTDRGILPQQVLTVAIQDGEELVWRLPLSVSQVQRQARTDEGLHHIWLRRAPAPVLFDELIGVRVSTE